jgi:hypothetical protein
MIPNVKKLTDSLPKYENSIYLESLYDEKLPEMVPKYERGYTLRRGMPAPIHT